MNPRPSVPQTDALPAELRSPEIAERECYATSCSVATDRNRPTKVIVETPSPVQLRVQILQPIESPALGCQELSRFSRPATAGELRYFLRLRGSASAIAKSPERVENLPAVQFRLSFAESGDTQKLADRRWVLSAEFIERCIMHYHVCGDTLLLRRGSPPLAKIFAQLGVNFCNGGFGRRFW